MKWIVLAAAGVCAIGLVGYWGASSPVPRQEWEWLLAGDEKVQVASLVIQVHGGQIVLDDPASAGYWTKAFRSASQESYRLGASYYATVTFASGGSVEVGLYLSDGGDDVTVSSALGTFADPSYYRIQLNQPMPEPVAAALRQLR
jgi:hypothetical protein